MILCNLVTETLDDDADFNVPVDIFAIGFEEIVDLNAGNIVSARFAVCLIIVIAVIQWQLVAPTIMKFGRDMLPNFTLIRPCFRTPNNTKNLQFCLNQHS